MVPTLTPLAAAIRQMIWAELNNASAPSLELASEAIDREIETRIKDALVKYRVLHQSID